MADYDAKWFRSWHGAPTDPKWLVVARRAQVAPGMVSAVFWALMDYASQHTDRGSVEDFDVETYAAFTGWEESEIDAVLDAMRSKGIITPDDRLAAWDKRQPKKEDPTATERQQRKRERDREVTRDNSVTNDDVTQGNATVTPRHAMSRDVTTDKIREDHIRSEGDQTKTQADDDDIQTQTSGYTNGDGRAAAIDALQEFGLFNQPMLMQFNNIWPELSGREDWIGRAVTVARDKGATSPAYAIKVLMNAIHTGRAPGQKADKDAAKNDQSYEALKRRYIPEGWEDVVKH
jgi:hypothetical protein